MSARLLEGKPLAESLKSELKNEVDQLKGKYKTNPSLSVIQVGDNPASSVYANQQKKCADSLGIGYNIHRLSIEAKKEELFSLIDGLNKDDLVSGIIIQLPLPSHIDHKELILRISPLKDVEGLHPENLGKLVLGKPSLAPCTALACVELIKSIGVDLYGKEVVIVGHSEIVGKPLALLLLNDFATITVCHIGTSQKGCLNDHTKYADILVVAVGKAGLIKGEHIKEGVIVVDVGINKVGDRIVGDVEFESASNVASYITPVPGGVGPLTVVMLMKNTLTAFKLQRE
ncbi:MAG: bifunctional 5,10-methylenetetrahydrofolate dehydrogenase/5,10-methenyltetrahydrofolate cyclohydrolase [Candidatus Omnitrophica bacterium]|nr:bifunctional 5,10-methylenetetrahydrofolate dehydrogenase/5,10-methenyltetrahydrofolate cyclohydrolase [Candidatus Omnitrophota bacterium]